MTGGGDDRDDRDRDAARRGSGHDGVEQEPTGDGPPHGTNGDRPAEEPDR